MELAALLVVGTAALVAITLLLPVVVLRQQLLADFRARVAQLVRLDRAVQRRRLRTLVQVVREQRKLERRHVRTLVRDEVGRVDARVRVLEREAEDRRGAEDRKRISLVPPPR